MALSNTTHTPSGKAHGLTGKHGDKHATATTGLEFLTGDGAEGANAQPKQGVSFAALVQTIAHSALPAARKAEAGSDAVAPEADDTADKPDNPVALLAMALHDQGKHLGKRAHDIKLRALETSSTRQPVEALTTALPVADADKAEAHADKSSGDTNGSDTPEQAAVPSTAAQLSVASAVSPVIEEGTASERADVANRQTPAIAGKRAAGDDARREMSVTNRPPAIPSEQEETPKRVSETPKSDAIVETDNIQKKSEFSAAILQKINNKSEKETKDALPVSGQGIAVSKSESGSKPEASAKGDSTAAAPLKDAQPHRSDQASVVRSDAAVRDVPQPQFASASQPATIATNLTGALNSQVVDMGVSGQWIDDIARQIASIGANPGHGSFRIESQGLGAVRVDIAPSVHGAGSDVLMRVDNDAAFAALDKDRERLVQDARMASVRIGEVRIDRLAPAQDTQSSGSSTAQQQGNSAGQQGNQQAMNQTNAQAGGQGGQQPSRQDAAAMGGQRDGQNSPKTPFTNAVMNGAERDDVARNSRSGRSDTARYA